MVKASNSDFISKLDKYYTQAKDKNSIYLTLKRAYKERFKFKKNRKIRKQRYQDRKNQEQDSKQLFKIFVRAKHKRSSVSTIVKFIYYYSYLGR